MKVLFIGGTGIISSGCVQLADECHMDLTAFNRGNTNIRPLPQGVKVIHGDIRNTKQAADLISEHTFDIVVDFISYTPEQLAQTISLFENKVSQYVFVSSVAAYHKPALQLPITESAPLYNPWWEYAQNKIACEEFLVDKYRQSKFPFTIVRPAHTYDRTLIPPFGGWTVIDRIRRSKPVIVHGDGSSLWVLTHHTDVARGILGLLGNSHAIGDNFHITSDLVLNWNHIFELLGEAAGVQPRLIHIPTDVIAAYHKEWGDMLRGDLGHSAMYDNEKIKKVVPDFHCKVPFSKGAHEIIDWYDAHPEQQIVDPDTDSLFDRMIDNMQKALPD
jgi:nucleoside-diphosphate-sugar epimerase